MSQSLRICLLAFVALLALSTAAMAQPEDAEATTEETAVVEEAGGVSIPTAGIGIGIVVLGAGIGIGRIGGSAVEAMARQPEISAKIQTGMIIAAALIEGAAFFGILMAYLTIFTG